MTQYGDKLFNPDLRPYQHMEKTFFNVRQDLPAEGLWGTGRTTTSPSGFQISINKFPPALRKVRLMGSRCRRV